MLINQILIKILRKSIWKKCIILLKNIRQILLYVQPKSILKQYYELKLINK